MSKSISELRLKVRDDVKYDVCHGEERRSLC